MPPDRSYRRAVPWTAAVPSWQSAIIGGAAALMPRAISPCSTVTCKGQFGKH